MRFSTHIVLFIVTANALIGAASAAGMWDAWGIEMNTGVTDAQIQTTQNAFQNVTSGNMGASTLISTYTFATEMGKTGLSLVTALPSFLENLGVPGAIAAIPNALVFILLGRDLWQIFTGRDI